MSEQNDKLLKANPYTSGLVVVAGLLVAAGVIAGISGLIAQNNRPIFSNGLEGVVQFAWANWLISGGVLGFFFYLAANGIAWAVVYARAEIPAAKKSS